MNQEDTALLQQLAGHLTAASRLLGDAGVAALAGPGLCQEINYAVSGFRQRFPALAQDQPDHSGLSRSVEIAK